jgi:putative ATPase
MNLFADEDFAPLAPVSAEPFVDESAPLAARLRPRSFDEFVGQKHLVGPESASCAAPHSLTACHRRFSLAPPESGKPRSRVCWPRKPKAHFEEFSAITGGVADVRRYRGSGANA